MHGFLILRFVFELLVFVYRSNTMLYNVYVRQLTLPNTGSETHCRQINLPNMGSETHFRQINLPKMGSENHLGKSIPIRGQPHGFYGKIGFINRACTNPFPANNY